MTLEIPELPEARRHIALLEYPPYLALALNNIGVKLTSSDIITIPDANTLQYKSMVLRNVHRNGSVYSYEASFDWGIGTLPFEVDLSRLDQGKIDVRIFHMGAFSGLAINLLRAFAPVPSCQGEKQSTCILASGTGTMRGISSKTRRD